MNLLLGLTFLLILSSKRSQAQDDSLAGSFLSGITIKNPIRKPINQGKKALFTVIEYISQLECDVCCYVCLRNGIFRNLIYANRPISFSFFLLHRFLIEFTCNVLISVFITFIYIHAEKKTFHRFFHDTMTQFSFSCIWCEIFWIPPHKRSRLQKYVSKKWKKTLRRWRGSWIFFS